MDPAVNEALAIGHGIESATIVAIAGTAEPRHLFWETPYPRSGALN